jgi:Tol biopolymer transport system component
VPLTSGQSVRSELAPQVEKRIKDAALEFQNFQWAASGRALFLEGSSQGVRNLWKVEVDPRTLRWVAGPERLTTGAGHDVDIALTPDGRKLAFTTRIERARVWALPFDATAGQVAGTGQPVTAAGVDVVQFNLSRDDQQLAFIVNRAGKQEVRKKSLADGSETLLVAADGIFRQSLHWTPDGSRLAYNRRRFTNPERTQWEPAIVSLPANGGDEQVLAGDGMPYDWSADGKWLLHGRIDRVANRIMLGLSPISAAPRAETQWRLLASDPDHNLFHARYSPDNRWIVFNAIKATDAAASTLYVIPATGGAWTRVTEGRYWDDKSQWSPDGRTIYFISNRGGYYNVWGIRFDPASGKPVGEAFRVTNWEGANQMISPQIGDVCMAVTTDLLLLPITEASGNIWTMENVDR